MSSLDRRYKYSLLKRITHNPNQPPPLASNPEAAKKSRSTRIPDAFARSRLADAVFDDRLN